MRKLLFKLILWLAKDDIIELECSCGERSAWLTLGDVTKPCPTCKRKWGCYKDLNTGKLKVLSC